MRISRAGWTLIALAGTAGIVAAGVALFEWNMLRHPLAGYMSATVGRSIKIDGELKVDISRQPVVSADSITIGNAPWSSEPVMARAQRIAVRVDLASLWDGRVALPEVKLVQPRIVLERTGDGRANWELARVSDPSGAPRIGRPTIEDRAALSRNLHSATDVTFHFAPSLPSESATTPP